jgi:DNA-binding transcriptional MerR regulator
MKIGELARRSGVSIDAIRYYERREVLPRAERTASGYRVFGQEAVARLDLVRRLQDLGFTLDEVVDALHAHDRGDATCASERWRLERVGDRIDHKIEELQRTRRTIRGALAACDAGRCRLSSPADSPPDADQPT